MNRDKKITLDLGMLYGFKLLVSGSSEAVSTKIGGKIGEKTTLPGGSEKGGFFLDSKIGAKEGIKN